jgi:hypothetical protein
MSGGRRTWALRQDPGVGLLFVRFAYQTNPTGLISAIDPVRFKRYALSPRLPLWP